MSISREPKKHVCVEVKGRPASGKTTIAAIIEKALMDAGFEVECDLKSTSFEGQPFEEYTDDGIALFKEKLPAKIERLRQSMVIHITQHQLKRGDVCRARR